MKTIEIKGTARKDLGKKSSRQTRKAGNVPCVIYRKEGNLHFEAPELSFKNLVYTHEAHLVKFHIDSTDVRAVLKDIQFHPVTDRIIHADFIEIFDDKPVVINVPVTVTGDSIGVIAGGKLSIKKRYLLIKALPDDLPENITIDITKLKIHDSVKVGELSADKIEFLDNKKLMILTIATSRVAQKSVEETAEEPAEEAAAEEQATE
ncbi:MAG TPA: 50S ribosomal protein L25/general stress protein Ctc [Bacteroidales bacterium]|nr:50S ribosomal protein L25/general stress protein Ctc [Bacteroidales bacterium]